MCTNFSLGSLFGRHRFEDAALEDPALRSRFFDIIDLAREAMQIGANNEHGYMEGLSLDELLGGSATGTNAIYNFGDLGRLPRMFAPDDRGFPFLEPELLAQVQRAVRASRMWPLG